MFYLWVFLISYVVSAILIGLIVNMLISSAESVNRATGIFGGTKSFVISDGAGSSIIVEEKESRKLPKLVILFGALVPSILVTAIFFLCRDWSYAKWYLLGFGAGIFSSLLFGFLPGVFLSGGYKINDSHAWFYRTSEGKPGAYSHPASERDVYEHYHGPDTWEKKLIDERFNWRIFSLISSFIVLGLVLFFVLSRWEIVVGLTLSYLIVSFIILLTMR